MPDIYNDFVFGGLTASVNVGDTSASLDDVSTFPSNTLLGKADFYVGFDSPLTHPASFEVVKVTAVNTVAKTIAFTPAATYNHAIGTFVKGTLTAGMLTRLRGGAYGTTVPVQDNSIYEIGDRFLLTTTNTLYVYTTAGFIAVGSGTRQTTTATSVALAPYAMDSSTTMPLSQGYRLYSISTSRPARVRLYTTAAARASDLTRGVGVDPASPAGVVLDYVTTGSGVTWALSPLVDGTSLESTPSASIPMTVTNNDTVTGTISVTFTWIKTE